MKAIVFERFGEPREVLQVREVTMPAAPAAGSGHIMRALAAIVALFAALSLALWATVWLVIQLP